MQTILLDPTLIFVLESSSTQHMVPPSRILIVRRTTATIQDMHRVLHGWGPLEIHEGEHIKPSYIQEKTKDILGVFHLQNGIRLFPCIER